MNLCFQRAVIWMALSAFCSFGMAKKKAFDNLETYTDQIKKSQVLLLQRDRYQASKVLIAAIHREGIKSQAYIELFKALKAATEFFFSESAHQSYEMGIASFPSNKPLSIEKFKESLRVEPNNVLVLKALNFTYLALRDCEEANRIRLESTKMNPYDENLEKFMALELVCFNKKEEFQITMSKLDLGQSKQEFWLVNKQRSASDSLVSISQEIKNTENEYSELIFMRWLIETRNKKRLLLAEKYKNLCHSPISFDKAYEIFDPWICGHLKEMEEFIQRGESAG